MNWSSNYHNLLWVFLFMCAASFALLPGSAEEAEQERMMKEAEAENRDYRLKHGRIDSKDSNGNVKSSVNYVNGKKEGVSYLYYPDGKVQLEMTYASNLRVGTSKKYYVTGELYATTPFKNNVIEGERKTFYESGKLLASVPYHNSWPGTGLKEYLSSGKERKLKLGIEVQKEGSLWLLRTEEPCRKANFYLGSLVDGRFLNKNALVPLQTTNGAGILDLKKIGGEKNTSGLEVVCRCWTQQNNPLILSKKL
ncbi:MAG: hypothetical protein R8G66_20275 [Cytophagales bacterium]|nr:hypothetical protein [Cytophagales bacterium]